MRKTILSIIAAVPLALTSSAQINAALLRFPDVSATQIVFTYANDLWVVPKEGGKALHLSSPAGVVAGMTSGRVDACTIFEPYGSILMVEHGATMISNLGDDSFGISNGGLYVHNDFIRKYPELTQDIVDATVKATDFVIKDKAA